MYSSCAGMILPLHLHYICVCIYMFVHHTVSEFILLCMVFNIIISCTMSYDFCSISILCVGYSSTALLLHLRLNYYVCEYYIYIYYNMLVYFTRSINLYYSILDQLVAHISRYILLLYPSSLTCIHNILLTPFCLNLLLSYHIH